MARGDSQSLPEQHAREQLANSRSHAEPKEPEKREEPEFGPVNEGHGATRNGTDLALEEAWGEDGLDSEGGLGIEDSNSEVGRLLQLVGLQNSDIDSDLPDCEPQAHLGLQVQI